MTNERLSMNAMQLYTIEFSHTCSSANNCTNIECDPVSISNQMVQSALFGMPFENIWNSFIVVEHLNTLNITVAAGSIIEMNNSTNQIQRTRFYG